MAHFRLQTRNSVVWPFPFSQPICGEALAWCLDEWIMCFPRWQASLGKLMSTYWAREGEFHSFFLCTLSGFQLLFTGHVGVASHHWLMDATSWVIGAWHTAEGRRRYLAEMVGSGGTRCYRLSFICASHRCHGRSLNEPRPAKGKNKQIWNKNLTTILEYIMIHYHKGEDWLCRRLSVCSFFFF